MSESAPSASSPSAIGRIITVVIGFVHDWSAGIWAAAILGIWWVSRAEAPAEAAPVLAALCRQFFWISVGAVVTVFATGAGRTFTYVDGVYGPDTERARRKALVVKHVVLLAVFGGGTAWAYGLAFR